jgi:hypothetical protein
MQNIVEQLRELFKAVEEGANFKGEEFAIALFDYCSFIGNSPETSIIVNKMAKDFDIDREVFHRLFLYSAFRNGVRNLNLGKIKQNPGIPLFWDKEIEEEYHVGVALLLLIKNEKDKLNKKFKKKQGFSIFDFEIPKFENQEDYEKIKKSNENKLSKQEEIFRFRVFNNELITRITNHSDKKLFFDKEKSILYISNSSIKFRKFTEQYHCLRVLFSNEKNLSEEHFFDEIADKIDHSKNYTNKQIHNYFYAIKNRISSKTGVEDLFLTTNQSITINSDYL